MINRCSQTVKPSKPTHALRHSPSPTRGKEKETKNERWSEQGLTDEEEEGG